MKLKIFLAAVLCVLVVGVSSVSAKQPLKTLVVTGQNNHNWQVSHQAFKLILENSGMFTVDFAISPAKGGDMSIFKPEFANYDLVLLDYNGDPWSDETNAKFLAYAQNGGGIIVYHAADNAFVKWDEYNKIIALGGWEGRNEQSGPYVYVKDGQIVRDTSPGGGGNHGPQHQYVLDAYDTTHPIMKGLPIHWKHAQDELYEKMRGPGNIKSLFYTAYASPSQRGSGREEPQVFTVDYGKARIFHIMMGHAGNSLENNPAMQCAGFQVLLLRGAEWAATGKVKQRVPADFPTEDRISMRPDYKKP